MVYRLAGTIVAIVLCCSMLSSPMAQSPDITRTIMVKDGLPQSYVSGIVQDSNGYLRISTLNGFCRYDGRKYNYYRHTFSDSAGLSDNIILHLFDLDDNNLLLCYMDGRIDVFNTITEKITPLWKTIGSLRSESAYFKTLVHNTGGICWMLASDGGIFRIDPRKKTLRQRTRAQLGLAGPVIGLAVRGDSLCLITDSTLISCDKEDRPIASSPYPFRAIKRFRNRYHNFYSPAVRTNGDLLLCDAEGIKIWNPATSFYKLVSMERAVDPGKLMACFDGAGNYFFEYKWGHRHPSSR